MFESDLLLAFLFMAILFLRQISILKQPNKINYAPLMIGIGAIGSVVHFIIHPDATDLILLLRESFFPLLVALLLYIVMNILHQTQKTQTAKTGEEFTQSLILQVTELKEFMSELEYRISASKQEDLKSQNEIREKFSQDLKALDTIQRNQSKFLDKFDELGSWHEGVSHAFEEFSTKQLPELDNVVHKHIDILRISEQEHFNYIKSALNKVMQSRGEMAEDLDEVKVKLNGMKTLSDDIARSITKHTLQQLSGVTEAFEKQIVSLKSHTEGVSTSLYEGENRLVEIREQSEMIMQQMLLSSQKMDELKSKNDGLHDIYSTAKELVRDIEFIKADYVKSQSQLANIAKGMKFSEEEQMESLKNHVEILSETLTKKIEESLAMLHEHFHIAEADISQSVQILAKKLQVKKGYENQES